MPGEISKTTKTIRFFLKAVGAAVAAVVGAWMMYAFGPNSRNWVELPAFIEVVTYDATSETSLVSTDTICSAPQTSTDCHNRKDGESGCPSRHTFLLKASSNLEVLRSPYIDCVSDNRSSCGWNRSNHWRRSSWQYIGNDIEFNTPVSSRSIELRACAVRDRYAKTPGWKETERARQEVYDDAQFEVTTSNNKQVVLHIHWPMQRESTQVQRIAAGQDANTIRVKSGTLPSGAISHYYTVDRSYVAKSGG